MNAVVVAFLYRCAINFSSNQNVEFALLTSRTLVDKRKRLLGL